MGLLSSLFKVTRLPATIIAGILGFPEAVVSAALSLPTLGLPQLMFYGAIGAFVFSVIVPKYCKNLSEFRDCLREFLILLDSKKPTPEPQPEPAPEPVPQPEPPKLKRQVLRDVPLKPIESTPKEENVQYESPPTPMEVGQQFKGGLFRGCVCDTCRDYFSVAVSDDPCYVTDYICKCCGTRYKFNNLGERI